MKESLRIFKKENFSRLARVENTIEATARIEAALYSAGRPLRIRRYH